LNTIEPYRGDYYPILGQLMNEMNLAGIINETVGIEQSQAKVDVGTFTCLIIHNLLGDVNIRLYRMNEFFEDKALPLMIPWNHDIDINDINDDRAARVLDAIWDADPQKVFSTVSYAAIKVHDLETNIIHGDTTSRTFEGTYDKQEEHGDVPFITHGFNKDHRPDLKQLVFGVGTTIEGVPVMAEIADGNESDKTLNGRWVKSLRTQLRKEDDEPLTYVADSSLITVPNLRLIDKYHIDIISRLPGIFAIENQLKRSAIEHNKWKHIGKISEEKGAAVYKSWDTTDTIDNRAYRFIVVKSDQKDKRKLKSLDRSVKKEKEDISVKLKDLQKRPFACKRDAEIETEKFFKKHKVTYHQIDWKIKKKEERIKRKRRGRPKKNETIEYQTSYYLKGDLKKDMNIYKKEHELCGLFVLITTLHDTDEYPSKSILERYKGQGNVERIFKFIKNPAWIGAFCLKKTERLVALGYVLLIAAIVYTIWERRVRKALEPEGVEPIEGLNRIKTKKPTAFALQIVMSRILILSQRINETLFIWLPKPLNPNQKRIIELSGFSEDIYSIGTKDDLEKIAGLIK